MQPLSRSMRLLLALVVGVGLVAASCGDDDDVVDTDPGQQVEETEEMTEDEEMEEEMTEDEMMDEEEMTEEG